MPNKSRRGCLAFGAVQLTTTNGLGPTTTSAKPPGAMRDEPDAKTSRRKRISASSERHAPPSPPTRCGPGAAQHVALWIDPDTSVGPNPEDRGKETAIWIITANSWRNIPLDCNRQARGHSRDHVHPIGVNRCAHEATPELARVISPSLAATASRKMRIAGSAHAGRAIYSGIARGGGSPTDKRALSREAVFNTQDVPA